MASLKLLQTVGASILAFTSKGKVLVERDSASGPGSHSAASLDRHMPFVFGKAFIYDPKSGELSTVPEFESVPLGNIGKHLSQKEVQAAIRELGRVIGEDRRSSEEGSLSPNSKGSL